MGLGGLQSSTSLEWDGGEQQRGRKGWGETAALAQLGGQGAG